MLEGADQLVERPVDLEVAAAHEHRQDEERVAQQKQEHGVLRVGRDRGEGEGPEFLTHVPRVQFDFDFVVAVVDFGVENEDIAVAHH